MFEQLIIFSLNNSEFRVVSANILLNKYKERLSFNYILKERLIIELRDIEKQHGTHLTTLHFPFFGPLLILLSFCPNIRGKTYSKNGSNITSPTFTEPFTIFLSPSSNLYAWFHFG